jgi:hypothetical protein
MTVPCGSWALPSLHYAAGGRPPNVVTFDVVNSFWRFRRSTENALENVHTVVPPQSLIWAHPYAESVAWFQLAAIPPSFPQVVVSDISKLKKAGIGTAISGTTLLASSRGPAPSRNATHRIAPKLGIGAVWRRSRSAASADYPAPLRKRPCDRLVFPLASPNKFRRFRCTTLLVRDGDACWSTDRGHDRFHVLSCVTRVGIDGQRTGPLNLFDRRHIASDSDLIDR